MILPNCIRVYEIWDCAQSDTVKIRSVMGTHIIQDWCETFGEEKETFSRRLI